MPEGMPRANRALKMCYFNNMGIAVRKIRPMAKRALIIDIDLHYGDGTVSIFRGGSGVEIVTPCLWRELPVS